MPLYDCLGQAGRAKKGPERYTGAVSSAIESGKRRPTYADIEALGDNVVGEIIAGELVVSPRPSAPHAYAASNLGATVNTRFHQGLDGPGGWWIIDEPELSLDVDPDYDPVVPDMAGWRQETMPNYPLSAAQFHTVPDWICEVLSPSTRRHDRLRKLPFYHRAGVGHAWLVDPMAQSIEVYRGTPDGWLLVTIHQGGGEIRAEPFDAVAIDLDRIWLEAPETPEEG